MAPVLFFMAYLKLVSYQVLLASAVATITPKGGIQAHIARITSIHVLLLHEFLMGGGHLISQKPEAAIE
jgi:hypothetical protein